MAFVTIPIFPSSNFDDTAHFYSVLGFTERHRYPDYLTVARADGFELHFWLHRELKPLKNDVACYVRFDTAAEARALYDEWAKLDLAGGSLRPPVETDYGLLELALLDPHRNLIRIGGSLP